MKTNLKFMLLASAAAGSLVLSPAAFAQSATAPSEAAKPDDTTVLIVSARRRDEVAKDVPIAVTSYSAEKLGRTGAPDITALQQTTSSRCGSSLPPGPSS